MVGSDLERSIASVRDWDDDQQISNWPGVVGAGAT